MLVLSRKRSESIKIGDDIVITVLQSDGGRVRLGIDAPKGTPILRTELIEATSAPSSFPGPITDLATGWQSQPHCH